MSSVLFACRKKYQEKLQELLVIESFPGISLGELTRFKRDFRSSAFTCRHHGCLHATVGFETNALRCDHEQMHREPLQCLFPGCQYGLPFPSTRALKAHIAKIHHTSRSENKPRLVRQQVRQFPGNPNSELNGSVCLTGGDEHMKSLANVRA